MILQGPIPALSGSRVAVYNQGHPVNSGALLHLIIFDQFDFLVFCIYGINCARMCRSLGVMPGVTVLFVVITCYGYGFTNPNSGQF